MAKYTYDYACGHGSAEVQLFGKNEERERRLQWYADNMLCRECYKQQKLDADAAAPQALTLTLVCNPDRVILQLEASGKIEEHKQALQALGYKWRDAQSGLLGMLSTKRPGLVLCVQQECRSFDEVGTWLAEATGAASALGYTFNDSNLNALDMAQMQQVFAKMAELDARRAEVEDTDPRPGPSPLRQRIAALEKETGAKWNGKFYGTKGSWTFYVNNVKYTASDKEVSDRQQMMRNLELWKERHPDLEP